LTLSVWLPSHRRKKVNITSLRSASRCRPEKTNPVSNTTLSPSSASCLQENGGSASSLQPAAPLKYKATWSVSTPFAIVSPLACLLLRTTFDTQKLSTSTPTTSRKTCLTGPSSTNPRPVRREVVLTLSSSHGVGVHRPEPSLSGRVRRLISLLGLRKGRGRSLFLTDAFSTVFTVVRWPPANFLLILFFLY